MNVSDFSVELKVETPIGDYRLPVVTGRAEPQEGDGIARAWIEDPKVYPGIPMPQWWRLVPEGTVVATGARFVKTGARVFVVNTCQALLAHLLESSGMRTRFGKLSTKKNTSTNLRSHQIYIKIEKYCKFIIFIFFMKVYFWTSDAGIPA